MLVDKSGELRTLFETAVASTYANTTLVFLHSVLQCSGPPHHIYYAQCSTHLLVCITVSYPAIVYSAHSQSCCVAYYQVVQGNHTCSANNKILLFQSPCTGTRQCGQVISFFYFICSNIYFFKKVKTTVKNELTSGFPDIAMFAADKTRHGSIPVIGVSGREKRR